MMWRHSRRRWISAVAATTSALLVFAEAAARLSGAVDFPLYHADNVIGYIPAPNQEGNFLRRHTWRLNSLSMGAGEFNPRTDAPNALLVGDSLVWGGNPYREEDRLGPQLERASHLAIWPASAPSWALRNELTYIRLHPEVVRAVDAILLLVNNGDFDAPSSWACDLTHPRERPTLAIAYLFRKYVWGHCDAVRPDMEVPHGDWRSDMRAFTSSPEVRGKPVIVFLYPDHEETATPDLIAQHLESHIPELRAAGVHNIVSIGRDPRWNISHYKDEIHPTAAANRVLASIMAQPLESAIRAQGHAAH